jgi:hypothetical protein
MTHATRWCLAALAVAFALTGCSNGGKADGDKPPSAGPPPSKTFSKSLGTAGGNRQAPPP